MVIVGPTRALGRVCTPCRDARAMKEPLRPDERISPQPHIATGLGNRERDFGRDRHLARPQH